MSGAEWKCQNISSVPSMSFTRQDVRMRGSSCGPRTTIRQHGRKRSSSCGPRLALTSVLRFVWFFHLDSPILLPLLLLLFILHLLLLLCFILLLLLHQGMGRSGLDGLCPASGAPFCPDHGKTRISTIGVTICPAPSVARFCQTMEVSPGIFNLFIRLKALPLWGTMVQPAKGSTLQQQAKPPPTPLQTTINPAPTFQPSKWTSPTSTPTNPLRPLSGILKHQGHIQCFISCVFSSDFIPGHKNAKIT